MSGDPDWTIPEPDFPDVQDLRVTRDTPLDRTSLSYWFPRLEAAGLPVPRTRIIHMPVPAQEAIWEAFDGKGKDREGLRAFHRALAVEAEAIGFPCFLRTDHTSGKHSWERTCFLSRAEEIPRHVFSLAEHSACAGFLGLPWSTWVVRELLPTIPLGVCPAYGNMPICKEFRFFVSDDRVICSHPYWPLDALQQGGADAGLDYDELCRMSDADHLHLLRLAAAAGKAVGGDWSVDILHTSRGWFIIDMAEAEKSFHWEGCPERGGSR